MSIRQLPQVSKFYFSKNKNKKFQSSIKKNISHDRWNSESYPLVCSNSKHIPINTAIDISYHKYLGNYHPNKRWITDKPLCLLKHVPHVSTRLFHSHADGNEETATAIGVQVSLLAIIAEASESISSDLLFLFRGMTSRHFPKSSSSDPPFIVESIN